MHEPFKNTFSAMEHHWERRGREGEAEGKGEGENNIRKSSFTVKMFSLFLFRREGNTLETENFKFKHVCGIVSLRPFVPAVGCPPHPGH